MDGTKNERRLDVCWKLNKYSEVFRSISNIFENFPKMFNNRKNSANSVLNRFQSFPKTSLSFRRFKHVEKPVKQCFSWDIVENAPCHLYFLRIHTCLKVPVYTKSTGTTRGIFHGIPRESIA